MANKEKIAQVIEHLRHVIKRPAMYFGYSDNADLADRYLDGLQRATAIYLEIERVEMLSREEVAQHSRGHAVLPKSPTHLLREQGIPEEEIIAENLQIHIAMYEQLMADID